MNIITQINQIIDFKENLFYKCGKSYIKDIFDNPNAEINITFNAMLICDNDDNTILIDDDNTINIGIEISEKSSISINIDTTNNNKYVINIMYIENDICIFLLDF